MDKLPDTRSNFDRAIELANLGYRCIPLVGRTKSAAVRWKRFQAEAPSEAELRHWFHGTDSNMAIITGAGLVVVDCDSPDVVQIVLQRCGHTPMRCCTPTPGHMHLYYRMRSRVRYGSAVRIHERPIDLRCEGAYVVAPPSANAAGIPYEWVGSVLPLSTLPLLKVRWLRERAPKRSLMAVEPGDSIDVMIRRATAYLATVEGAISGQRGHHRCMRAAGILVQKFGLGIEQALPILREWNQSSCEPPFSEKELMHKLTDAVRLRPQRGLKPIP